MTTLQKLGLVAACNIIAFLLWLGAWFFINYGYAFIDISVIGRIMGVGFLGLFLFGGTAMALFLIQEYERDDN